jgi:hypothetical protein
LEGDKAKRAETHAKQTARQRAPRVSTTEPEARLMRRADGASRPAWNLQVAAANGFVLAVEPTDRRNDTGLAHGLIEQVRRRCGRSPDRLLADTRSITQADIVHFAELHPRMTIYAPPAPEMPTASADSARKRLWRRSHEPAPLKAWRARMASEHGK